MDTKSVFTKSFGKPKKDVAPVAPIVPKDVQPAAPKRKTAAKKETAAINFDSEHIVRAIHQQKEELQRITVDMPKDIYQSMKVHLAHENVSIRDFIVRLVDVYLTRNNIR